MKLINLKTKELGTLNEKGTIILDKGGAINLEWGVFKEKSQFGQVNRKVEGKLWRRWGNG